MSELLRLSNLGQRFGEAAVLRDVNLTVAAGERVAVLGALESGETTLLRLIAGLEAPSAGDISILGATVSTPGRVAVPPERRGVAMVFQGPALFPNLRALDQIAFAAGGRGGMEYARWLLGRIGLGHRASAALDELSGGERQRIALARALAQRPRLLLMDEPFASLDEPKRADMRLLLRVLLDESGTTLLLVTHARDDALDLAQRALVLDRGRAVAADSMENLLARPGHAAVARRLGLGRIIEGVGHGEAAQTALGPVRLTRAANGPIEILIRPGQPRIADGGVSSIVIGSELRPARLDAPGRVAVVRVESTVLKVELNDGARMDGV